MNIPSFGKTADRIPSPDGKSAEIYRRGYKNATELMSEHWHEESTAVASQQEADDVISNAITKLIGGGITDAVSFTVLSNPKTHQLDRVVTTHLVERKR